MQLTRSVLADQPAELLFDVIEAAEHDPRFLPWCAGARILQRDAHPVAAELQVRWRGLAFSLRTRNPERRPEHMRIELEQGPFRHFRGEWQLTPLAAEACKVVFRLEVEGAGGLVAQLTGPAFNQVAGTLVDAFVQRARSLAPDGRTLAPPALATATPNAPSTQA